MSGGTTFGGDNIHYYTVPCIVDEIHCVQTDGGGGNMIQCGDGGNMIQCDACNQLH